MNHLIPLLACALAATVTTAQTVEFSVERLGTELDNRSVYELVTAGDSIYAAADSAGLFVLDASQSNPEWTYVGLRDRRCVRLAVAPDNHRRILAVLRTQPPVPGSDVIVRSEDAGATWSSSDAGIDTSGRPSARRIRFSPHDASLVVALFVDYYGELQFPPYVSRDTGRTWTPLAGAEEFSVQDVQFDPQQPLLVYAIATHDVYGPAFLRSFDGGTNWMLTPLPFAAEDIPVSLAINPLDPNHMVVSVGWGMAVSIDRGESWSTASTVPSTTPVYRQLAWHQRDTGVAFSAGNSTDRSAIGASIDNGYTWTSLRVDSLAQVTTVVPVPGATGSFAVGSIPNGFVPQARSGVFKVTLAVTSAVNDDAAGDKGARFDGRRFSIPTTRPLGYRIYDASGRVMRSGLTVTGSVSTEGLPSGPCWLVTSDGRVVRGQSVGD